MRLRSSQLQSTSLCAIKKWTLWRSDMQNASPKADALGREVYIQALTGRNLQAPGRIWKLRPPVYGLGDGPVDSNNAPRAYLLGEIATAQCIGFWFWVSPFGPHPYFLRRPDGRSVGVK